MLGITYPRAFCKELISFLILNISIAFSSAALASESSGILDNWYEEVTKDQLSRKGGGKEEETRMKLPRIQRRNSVMTMVR